MAIDWTKAMRQGFAFCEVDPRTWADARELRTVSSCTVTRDLQKDTWESGTIVVGDPGWLSTERIVRAYLVAEQGGEAERVCVATLAYQGETEERDGARAYTTADGYGLLQDMAADSPPYGYSVSGDPSAAIGEMVAMSCRAPYVGYDGLSAMPTPMWAADGDSWLTLAIAVAQRAGCLLRTDAQGRVCLVPDRPVESLSPSWTYGLESCIVLPRVTRETDLFGIPNWCEVTVSDGTRTVVGTAENADPASPTSTASRGHRVPLRLTNPDGLSPSCSKADADAFAERSLADAGAVTRTWRYSHAWCPVTPGQAVLIDVGGDPSTAMVTRQEIRLKVGVEVAEEAESTGGRWSL